MSARHLSGILSEAKGGKGVRIRMLALTIWVIGKWAFGTHQM
jgi:hypothetical protein